MLRQYQEQFRQTQATIEAQAKEQEQRLASEAETQRKEVSRQVEEARTKVRGGISAFEVERQKTAQQLREAERMEQRKRSLSTYTPTQLGTEEKIEALETTATSVLGEARVAREDIEKQQVEALLDLDKALAEAMGKVASEKERVIEEARQQYEAESVRFEEANIQLGDGAWVDKKEWEIHFEGLDKELSDKYRNIGLSSGLDAMNKAIEDDSAKFQAENVEITPDKWVNKVEWERLTPSQQDEVRVTGE